MQITTSEGESRIVDFSLRRSMPVRWRIASAETGKGKRAKRYTIWAFADGRIECSLNGQPVDKLPTRAERQLRAALDRAGYLRG